VDAAEVTTGNIAAVVIGRNEGQRLKLSLCSVQNAGLPVVYVDSGSTDGSLALAAELALPVVALDPARPFSAARARNEGLTEAIRRWPGKELILFLDGDCVLDSDFPGAAEAIFEQHSNSALVTGQLSERHPERSVYNKLCAIEWRSAAGPIVNMNALGGIMVVRASAFTAVGGFDEDAIAGEEPDLGVRLALAGYSMIKIDVPMAMHDANILTFRQWWKRAVRSGHALSHRYAQHGKTAFRDGRRELLSALFWAFAVPAATLILCWPTHGLSLLLLGGYVVLGWRVYEHYLRAGFSTSDAWLASRFIIYGKFAQVVGIVRYWRARRRGRFEIIEHK